MSVSVKAWNDALVFYQDGDDDDAVPEPALLIHIDQGGTLVIQQESRAITINRASFAALLRTLRTFLPGLS